MIAVTLTRQWLHSEDELHHITQPMWLYSWNLLPHYSICIHSLELHFHLQGVDKITIFCWKVLILGKEIVFGSPLFSFYILLMCFFSVGREGWMKEDIRRHKRNDALLRILDPLLPNHGYHRCKPWGIGVGIASDFVGIWGFYSMTSLFLVSWPFAYGLEQYF